LEENEPEEDEFVKADVNEDGSAKEFVK